MRLRRAAVPLAVIVLVATTVTATAATAATVRPADWATYHGGTARGGYARTMAPVHGTMRIAANVKLDGAVYASPLVIGGTTIVATENNTVYAFGGHYRLLWKRHLGAPSPASQRPCGDIAPLGITGTPIYSAATGDVYLVASLGRGSVHHDLFALAAKTGATRWRRSIDVGGVDPTVMQQRGALSISNGRVWAPFGALAGDCGNYKGRVMSVRLGGHYATGRFQPSTNRQGGIWNPAAGTGDGRGHLYYVSANGSTFPGAAYDHTNSVNEITTANAARIDSFAPSDWAQNNQADAGLGSQGVAFVGTKWAVLGGKSGPVYVLRRNHLGGIGGQVSVQNICRSFGGAAVNGDVVYLPCTDGVRAVRVDSAGQLHVLWHAPSSITGSPVVGGGRVWSLDPGAGVLYALNPATGVATAHISVGAASRFATEALYGHNVYVPTLTGLAVVATS